MLRSIIDEGSARKDGPQKEAAWLLVYGCEVDDIAFIDLVEDCGANVVIDDLCIGTREYWKDVALNGYPLKNLAGRYLRRLKCSRILWRLLGTRQQDLDNSFGYLLAGVRQAV